MRCGCPECGAFMVHEESGEHVGCVCPDCLYRCTACLGTDSVLTRDDIDRLRSGSHPLEQLLGSLTDEEDEQPGEHPMERTAEYRAEPSGYGDGYLGPFRPQSPDR